MPLKGTIRVNYTVSERILQVKYEEYKLDKVCDQISWVISNTRRAMEENARTIEELREEIHSKDRKIYHLAQMEKQNLILEKNLEMYKALLRRKKSLERVNDGVKDEITDELLDKPPKESPPWVCGSCFNNLNLELEDFESMYNELPLPEQDSNPDFPTDREDLNTDRYGSDSEPDPEQPKPVVLEVDSDLLAEYKTLVDVVDESNKKIEKSFDWLKNSTLSFQRCPDVRAHVESVAGFLKKAKKSIIEEVPDYENVPKE